MQLISDMIDGDRQFVIYEMEIYLLSTEMICNGESLL